MSRTRLGLGSIVLAGLVSAVVLSQSGAGENKALRDGVDKVAASIQKGDKDAAKKDAEAIAKKIEDLADLMDLFKPTKKGGIGFDDKTGIEQMLQGLGRDAPSGASLKKNAEGLQKMAYRTAAMALITHERPVSKASSGGARKEWNGWSDDIVEGSIKLAAAAKAMGAADVKTAAAKINAACNSCHSKHRQ